MRCGRNGRFRRWCRSGVWTRRRRRFRRSSQIALGSSSPPIGDGPGSRETGPGPFAFYWCSTGARHGWCSTTDRIEAWPRTKERAMKLDAVVAFVLAALIAVPAAALAWEPTKPIELVVPAGTGGGADQMARLIAGIRDKHKLSPRPRIHVIKARGAGAEGFLDVKSKKGDAHTLVITPSNLFTTPLHTGIPFSWRDLTPVARLALDGVILWVNADIPYKTAKEYLPAVKEHAGQHRPIEHNRIRSSH